MAEQDVPAPASQRGLICGFDGGSTPEFYIDRPVAFWGPEKFAVVIVVKREEGWQSLGAIWHTDREPNPIDIGYESSEAIRYELYELTGEAKRDHGARIATYVFKERL